MIKTIFILSIILLCSSCAVYTVVDKRGDEYILKKKRCDEVHPCYYYLRDSSDVIKIGQRFYLKY
jgi:hypothetical protein